MRSSATAAPDPWRGLAQKNARFRGSMKQHLHEIEVGIEVKVNATSLPFAWQSRFVGIEIMNKTVDRPNPLPVSVDRTFEEEPAKSLDKDLFDAKGRLPPGWWLLPFTVMGLLVWSVLLGLLFG